MRSLLGGLMVLMVPVSCLVDSAVLLARDPDPGRECCVTCAPPARQPCGDRCIPYGDPCDQSGGCACYPRQR